MKTVLIMGGTGVIGSALTGLCLEDEDTEVRLVLRARSKEHLEERVTGLVAWWGLERAVHESGRLQAFRGDVSEPLFGLDEATYKSLVREVTHVVHSAGNVRLNQSPDDARRSLVDSTRHVLAFAEAGRRDGLFRKLEFVSTVGVAGRRPGLVPERPLSEPRGFRNAYDTAKAEAEEVLVRAQHEGLPATIHRPSMVVGDSGTGRVIHFQVFYYLCEFLAGRTTFGVVPDAGEMTLDIVPVDYVARAIWLSSGREDAAGRIFHLCSGPSQAVRINELSDRVREIFDRAGRERVRLRRVSPGLIRALLPLVAWAAPVKIRRALRGLPLLLAYLTEPQSFDTRETTRFFAPHDLVVPPVDAYLNRVVQYWLSLRAAVPRRGAA
jgi:thioester reductase-like protein